MASPERIVVTGFKSIRDMDLRLNPLNVLIGANGAGKSNFIGVFTLLREIVEERLQAYVGRSGGADSLLHYGRNVTGEISVEVSFDNNSYEAKLVPTANDSLVFENESCSGRGYQYPSRRTGWMSTDSGISGKRTCWVDARSGEPGLPCTVRGRQRRPSSAISSLPISPRSAYTRRRS